MQFRTECDIDKMIITVLNDRLDAVVAIQFKDAIREAATRGPSRIVIDMHRVTFLDSSGLGAVVGAMKLLAPERSLELARLNDPVAKVFHLTRMDTIFTIHDQVPTLDAVPSGSVRAK